MARHSGSSNDAKPRIGPPSSATFPGPSPSSSSSRSPAPYSSTVSSRASGGPPASSSPGPRRGAVGNELSHRRKWHRAQRERLTDRLLDSLPGYVVLPNRKIPEWQANSDHVAIGSGRVFRDRDQELQRRSHGERRPPLRRGRKRTAIAEQTWREAVNVQTVLAEHMARLAIDVVLVLCIHGAAGPWKAVKGVHLVGVRK